MKWNNCTSLEQLKENYENLSILRKEVKKDFVQVMEVNIPSWKKVVNIIKLLNKLNSKTEYVVNTSEKNIYFKNEVSEYIFYLLELDGETRLNKLGIKKSFYRDKEKAKTWKKKMYKLIHPDSCKHPNAEAAAAVINELHEEMVR